MCLSTVYKGTTPTDDAKLAEYITNIEIDEAAGTVRLYDITGETRDYKARLRSVDLIKNTAFLDLTQ
ncbi:MAG: CooT family nickel-binding protein [Clostridiales Family XIII bacterium]|jgi:predicted RNA-binding protein|nr:CooT family nickel-binding protein [Clostridiales Family XIII bacterium]